MKVVESATEFRKQQVSSWTKWIDHWKKKRSLPWPVGFTFSFHFWNSQRLYLMNTKFQQFIGTIPCLMPLQQLLRTHVTNTVEPKSVPLIVKTFVARNFRYTFFQTSESWFSSNFSLQSKPNIFERIAFSWTTLTITTLWISIQGIVALSINSFGSLCAKK